MTNVKLSPEELALVTDAELILTKNRIIQKVYELFGELSEEYKMLSLPLNEDVISISPKISKGENYLGLPWVMLDYPRNFSKTDVLAVRSFFWWGKFFSITLQLKGKFLQQYSSALSHLSKDWYICTDLEDAWQHHFDNDHYIPFDTKTDISQLPFIKLAKKIPLAQWENSIDFFGNSYKEIVDVLSTNSME